MSSKCTVRTLAAESKCWLIKAYRHEVSLKLIVKNADLLRTFIMKCSAEFV